MSFAQVTIFIMILVIKAISELHKIELSIFNIWKQLPVISYSNSEVKVPQLEELKQELEQQFQRQLQDAKEEEIGLTHALG